MFEIPRSHRRGENNQTALISIVVHIVAIAAFVVVPMTRIAALPADTLTTGLATPPRGVEEDDTPDSIEVVGVDAMDEAAATVPELDWDGIIAPRTIPSEIAAIADDIPTARRIRMPAARRGPFIGNGTGVFGPRGRRGISPPPPPPPLPPPPPPPTPDPEPRRVRVSAGVIQGHLVERVAPEYPSLARAAGITGTVTLEGVIDTDGKVTELRVLEGHPLLTGAAVDAVGQWRYEPYLLNGQPIDVVTLFSIVFRMD